MADDDLVDFQEEEDDIVETVPAAAEQKPKKEGYSGAHASSFRDLLLKPELLQAITKHGFEHPSEVQQECIPQAILGGDVLCQAKSGMGKTAVFVLSTLQQIKPVAGEVHVLVLCHTRELAYQIASEYNRFAENFDGIRTEVIYGGVNIVTQRQMLASNPPNIIVGTPGRVLQLAREGALKLNKIKHFVLDECDKILDSVDMRADIQDVFKMTPHSKQVMMFSATLSKATRVTCKKFMQNPHEIFVDDEAKLKLHGLVQYYARLAEHEKNRKLNDLLDSLDFNQVVIFVKSGKRAIALKQLMMEQNFPVNDISSLIPQEERNKRFAEFKESKYRILVATDVIARGIDVAKVNIVINYDMPADADTYLHRVGRAGRFGTKVSCSTPAFPRACPC
eukprot:TRINITY_DN19_c0_g1_i8.p1 TRINITY_DN19_c0_g1~~TRINITY_DN19_c0_g1_i8.p1  ORF type:complete len:408 (+),score=116.34 TRINITY_DN19_c0_g1_i8:47-1225(+)